jgi:WD40 repeat protein/tetratricopeptide (TPR) repeat protein/serine/threonine protein kinase
MSSTSKSARQVFLEAIESCAPGEWPAFLDRTCGDNAQLRRRVEVLLEAHVEEGSLLDKPAVEPPPTIEQPPSERAGMQIGPYKLLQQIGEGGFGVVYMAEQTEPVRRKVALKLIKPGMDTRQVIARFEAERQALAVMDHPNIAKVLDAGTVGHVVSPHSLEMQIDNLLHAGRPYFVMELVRGIPITQYCDENNLPIRERLELFATVCQAIQHAHTKGIIHRDIKPTNVLVTRQDGQPVVKVIDFGIAKALGQQLTEKTLFTEFAQMIGTPLYMSPEQAELSGTDIDTRSDIYSLGVLLYELLTGTTPVSKEQLKQAAFDEIRRIIREDEAQRPSNRISTAEAGPSIAAQRHTEPAKLARLVRGELDWIVMRALEKDRSRRYETASGFARDIVRYLNDEPVQACPPSFWYRFGKFARRNRGSLAFACVAALTVLLALVGLTVSNVLITNEKNLKVAALEQAKRNEETAKTQRGIAERNAIQARQQEKLAAESEAKAKASELLARRRFYAAQMNLAMQAWRAGEVPRVLELLEGQRPKAGEEDLRGFEWFYFWRLCQGGRRIPIRGHDRAALGLAFSPDGKTLASASWDRTVRLWDTTTGKELKVLRGHTKGVWEVAFSPDGKTLASSGQEAGSMILWDVASGKPLHIIAGSVEGPRFTADSKSVVGSYNGTGSDNSGAHSDVKAWDVASGKEQFTIPSAGIVAGLATTHGTLVTLANRYKPDSEIRVWDWPNNKRRLTIPGGAVRVALSPDGSRIASTTWGAIKLWDANTGDLLRELPTEGDARGLAFSPDGKRVACGLENRRVLAWEIETGNRIAEDVHLDSVWGLAFSADSKSLASSTLAGAIDLWDMTPAEEATTITGIEPSPGFPEASRRCIRFTPDGKLLFVGSAGLTRVVDVAAGKEIAVLPASGVGAISAEATVLAGRAGDSGFNVWDIPAGRKLPSIPFYKDSNVPTSALLSGDGATLASFRPWGSDNTVTLQDVATRQSRVLRIPPPESNRGSVFSADFSPDGKLLAAGYAFQWVTVWDLATKKVRLQFSQQPGMMVVYSVAFSPSGKTLAVGTNVGAVTLWDLDTGKQRVAFRGHTSFVHALAFSPDGGTLATAGADKTVRLWDVVTGQERGTLTGHTGWVTNVSFSPDGFTIATASLDGTVKLWRGATDALALAPRRNIARNPIAAPLSLPPGAIGLTDDELRAVARKSPDELQLQDGVARLLVGQGKFAEAEPHLAAVVRLAPERLEAYTQLADVLRRLKKFDEAEAILRQAIARDSSKAWLYDNLGWALWEYPKYPEAEQAFREAVRLEPRNANAQYGLGRARQAQKKFAESIEPLRAAQRLRPDDRDKLHALGWSCIEVQQFADAETTYRALIRQAPDDADAHHNLGWALLRQNKAAEAEASAREALRVNPQHSWAPQVLAEALIAQDKLAEAHSFLSDLVRRMPDNVEGFAWLAEALRRQRKFAEAEAAYAEAIRIDPIRPWTHESLGWLLWEQKKLAKAESAFREAVRLKPDLANAQFGLGQVLQNQRKFAEAVGPLREALRLDPTRSNIHGHFGWILIEQQSYAEAEADFRELIRLSPENSGGHFGLGKSLMLQKKFTEAAGPLREALRLDPTQAHFHGHLGWVFIEQQSFPEAEAEFREQIRLNPELSGGHFGLGKVLSLQKKFAEAEAELREAIRLAPTDLNPYKLLGWTLAEQKKFAEAESAFREAVRLAPQDTGGLQGLGRTLVEQKKFAEAEAPLREVLRLDPKHRWVPELLKRALTGQGKDEEAKAIQPADHAVQPVQQDNRVKESDPD